MIIVGLLLICVAAGFAVDVFVENSATLDVDVVGRTFAVDPGWLVVAGIIACAALFAGIRLIEFGLARRRARRKTLRSAQLAERERDELARQLEVERAARNREQDATSDQTSAPANPVESSESTASQSAR